MNERTGDWIQTYTARQFWPCDPRAEDICIEDIAHSLALQCRFTGHCTEFYSVAQHSVLVSLQVPPHLAMWGLLHDASEAYLTDLSRPLKRASCLGTEYKLIESRLMFVICERFGLPSEEPPEIKVADNRLLMTEKRDLLRAHGSLPKWSETEKPLEGRVTPWEWRTAEVEFINRFSVIELLARNAKNVKRGEK